MNTNKKNKGIKIGDTLPAFTLLNQHDAIISSANLAKHPLVIFFYPKDDTPLCIAEACSFRNYYDEFKEIGAEVVGISGDSRGSHAGFASRYNLPFHLLSDEDNTVRKQFGVPTSFLGMAPGRATYIFDGDGILVHHFSAFFQAKAHVIEALKELRKLKEA